MKFVETTVEIEKIIKAHYTEKIIRFCVLCMHFHVNLCSRGSCCTCKFVNEFVTFLMWSDSSAEENVPNFQKHCRLNHKEFYGLHSLLKSLAEEERKKVNLNDKLKSLLISNDGKQNRKFI